MPRRDKLIIEEELRPGLKGSLFANFSNYLDAILELTDNAVSNRMPNKKLRMDVLTSRKKITIINRGGYGMTLDDLHYFAKWGELKHRSLYDIGKYAQGGKSAMGYLGRSMVIIASPDGKRKQYRIEDSNLHDTTQLKKYSVQTIDGDYLDGCVQVEVGGIRRNIKEKDLQKKLIDIYRPLLENGVVDIYLNGSLLKPQSFPLDKNFKVEKFNFTVLDNNEVKGWIGRLGPRTGLKGGLRCYSKGRLICDKEFFGHPDASYKGTLNFLFGEVHLDFVPVIMNKTNFDRDSIQWTKTQDEMFKVLKPHIDELLGREIEEPSEEEIERVKQTRDIVAILERMRHREEKGSRVEGEDFGQKPPEPRERMIENVITGKKRGLYEPATPPPPGAIGKRRRTKEFMNWDLRPIEESTRSKIEKSENGEVLIINNIFSGYKAAKGNTLYLIETAALQLAKPEGEENISASEFITYFDELYSFYCDNLDIAREILKKKATQIKNGVGDE